MAVLFWIRSVQNGLNLTKLDQKRSRLIGLILIFLSLSRLEETLLKKFMEFCFVNFY